MLQEWITVVGAILTHQYRWTLIWECWKKEILNWWHSAAMNEKQCSSFSVKELSNGKLESIDKTRPHLCKLNSNLKQRLNPWNYSIATLHVYGMTRKDQNSLPKSPLWHLKVAKRDLFGILHCVPLSYTHTAFVVNCSWKLFFPISWSKYLSL